MMKIHFIYTHIHINICKNQLLIKDCYIASLPVVLSHLIVGKKKLVSENTSNKKREKNRETTINLGCNHFYLSSLPGNHVISIVILETIPII